jgi:hypothetical protein
MTALGACTNVGAPELRARPLNPSGTTIMTEVDIADSHASTAYDAIQRSHPLYLMSSMAVAGLTDREVCHANRGTREETSWNNRRFPDVYLNGVCLGGIGELRKIPVSSVREIRFVPAAGAGAFEIGSPGGMILVSTKQQ